MNVTIKSFDPSIGKPERYALIASQFSSLIAGENDFLANAANGASLLFLSLPDVNWAGFYFLRGTDLVLGPFHGKPACTRIPVGKGVCGAAAFRRETVVVPDVHQFPGHIACDDESRSEIVVPLIKNGVLVGVLDIDSPILQRFDEVDASELQTFTNILLSQSEVVTGDG